MNFTPAQKTTLKTGIALLFISSVFFLTISSIGEKFNIYGHFSQATALFGIYGWLSLTRKQFWFYSGALVVTTTLSLVLREVLPESLILIPVILFLGVYSINFTLLEWHTGKKLSALGALLLGVSFQIFSYLFLPVVHQLAYDFTSNEIIINLFIGFIYAFMLLTAATTYFLYSNLLKCNQLHKLPAIRISFSKNGFLFSATILYTLIIFCLYTLSNTRQFGLNNYATLTSLPFFFFTTILYAGVLRARFNQLGKPAHWLYLLCFLPIFNIIPFMILYFRKPLNSEDVPAIQSGKFKMTFFILFVVLSILKIVPTHKQLSGIDVDEYMFSVLLTINVVFLLLQCVAMYSALSSLRGFYALITINIVFYIFYPYIGAITAEKALNEFARVLIGYTFIWCSFVPYQKKAAVLEEEALA